MEENNKDIKISEMMGMQKELWEANKENWSPMEAKYGRNFLLWMIEEMGEAISIIKKKGDNAIMTNEEVRRAFVEELSDVLMYYNETLLRYGITANEISTAYIQNLKALQDLKVFSAITWCSEFGTSL